MRVRSWSVAILAAALLLAGVGPAVAQPSVTFSVGGFIPRGEDARVDGDVLLENRNLLLFDFADFNTGSMNVEFLVPIGEFLEAGVGAGFTRRTVPTIYASYVDRDGSEIEQDLRVRVVPLTATARILPLGRRTGFQPYVGGGLGWFGWRYSEVGEFIDFRDFSVFRARYVDEGSKVAPVAVLGARFALGDRFAIGGEFRYQQLDVDLGSDFLGPKLDLGGAHYLATFQFRF
jgi:opacity protein-like surface antigen